ncbi:MAG: Flp pilus assembly protein CpaB [Actinomycetia bacterium]|nr:Flp pilus assembly protein CpaB [Actinomycetes bacterium]
MSDRQRIVIAVVSATIAALLIGVFLQRSATAAERQQRALLRRYGSMTAQILVARKDLEPGTLLGGGDLKTQSWPVMLIPKGALLERDRGSITGKRITAWVAQGEPLVRKRVAAQVKRLDSLAAGLSAVTIATDAVHALGGEVSEGMRVTLMGTGSSGVVTALATDIEVLSSSKIARSDAGKSSGTSLLGTGMSSDISWVTLAVPTRVAAQILSSAQTGKLWLVLEQKGQR